MPGQMIGGQFAMNEQKYRPYGYGSGRPYSGRPWGGYGSGYGGYTGGGNSGKLFENLLQKLDLDCFKNKLAILIEFKTVYRWLWRGLRSLTCSMHLKYDEIFLGLIY